VKKLLNNLKIILLCTISLLYAQLTYAQVDSTGSKWKNYIDLNSYSVPFWKADTITDEISQVINANGISTGTLLFKAKKVLSVKAANFIKVFKQGTDWTYSNGKIFIKPGSAIPFIKKEDLVYTTDKPGWSMTGKAPGTFVLFSESTFFNTMQIAVTYIPEHGQLWKGPVPVFATKNLPHALSKLQGKEDLKVVFYGNSIETGCNSSGFQNSAPYMPSWPELIIYNLRKEYGPQVRFANPSVGGKLAEWGKEEAAVRVVPEKPDLAIIGFGMNDGSANISPDKYREDIRSMIEAVTTQNPNAEFILIAPMLPNPDAVQNGLQNLYKAELDKLCKTGIIVADLTGVHQELLKHKAYQDMTGNNVNHPNDYLARWYAQFICGFLIK
jgi:lysophospholipase L1-like esterase